MKAGDKVYHKSLKKDGTVADAAAVGHMLDPGMTVLVDFGDEDVKEVSISQLVLKETDSE
jgi:4-hydroxy-3-methylbut-2-en-1-yl diphosphate synthase IspG/GcpE